jgi:hypothetical protein
MVCFAWMTHRRIDNREMPGNPTGISDFNCNRVFLQPPVMVRWSDRSWCDWSMGHQIWELAPNPSQSEFAKTL